VRNTGITKLENILIERKNLKKYHKHAKNTTSTQQSCRPERSLRNGIKTSLIECTVRFGGLHTAQTTLMWRQIERNIEKII
jgi:hypothetical protein